MIYSVKNMTYIVYICLFAGRLGFRGLSSCGHASRDRRRPVVHHPERPSCRSGKNSSSTYFIVKKAQVRLFFPLMFCVPLCMCLFQVLLLSQHRRTSLCWTLAGEQRCSKKSTCRYSVLIFPFLFTSLPTGGQLFSSFISCVADVPAGSRSGAKHERLPVSQL